MNNNTGKQNIVIYGAGGHAKVIADIVEKSGNHVLAFVEDNKERWQPFFFDFPVLNGFDELLRRFSRTSESPGNSGHPFEVIIGIGINSARHSVRQKLEKEGIPFGTAIHPFAQIGKGVTIGEGTVVMANVAINPSTSIGKHCIINTSVSVDHDNCIGDFVHLSPGAHLGGGVSVGSLTWIGLGASVINNVKIGSNSIVGAGSVVIKDIESNVVVAGNPAKFLRSSLAGTLMG